jgi:two-component system, chemotaxis family, protein-glutamate methylesterase/glutaminase
MAETSLKRRKVLSKSNPNNFPIVVVGASAGGFNPILQLVSSLTVESNAAVFIVLHMSEYSNVSFLVEHLQKHTVFKCKLPAHGESVKQRTVYFGLPGMHLMLSKNKVKYGAGADENNFRPSIDVLFRTAAVEFNSRVIGIILSGLMDDGVAGMAAIKMCGGVCVVQDPSEAQYPALPLETISKVKVDHVVRTASMNELILKAANASKKKKASIPAELKEEVTIAQNMLTGIDETRKLGLQSVFTCPDCGGTMWHIHDKELSRFRCFTGHAYSEATLLKKQSQNIETTLWIALRLMEERKKMLEKFPALQRKSDKSDIEAHIARLRLLLGDLLKLESGVNKSVQQKINS